MLRRHGLGASTLAAWMAADRAPVPEPAQPALLDRRNVREAARPGCCPDARSPAIDDTGRRGTKRPGAKPLHLMLAGAVTLMLTHGASAREYFIGGPVHEHDMEIVANYLIGIEMAPMLPSMAHGPDVIHVEADVHATADNVYGYPDGAWVPYLTIDYRLDKLGTDWHAEGALRPMTAKDGPHYAENVRMDGPGKYKLTYRFHPPAGSDFFRHVDQETGVPEWWQPFTEEFTFDYPQQ